MNDWWKSPVLQGDDNDYGQYDYLIEEIPENYARWEFDRECKWKCDECKRDSHLLFRSAHYFHTLDGWDSMEYAECWMCRLKGKLHGIKWRVQRHVKTLKLALQYYKTTKCISFRYCYHLAKRK